MIIPAPADDDVCNFLLPLLPKGPGRIFATVASSNFPERARPGNGSVTFAAPSNGYRKMCDWWGRSADHDGSQDSLSQEQRALLDVWFSLSGASHVGGGSAEVLLSAWPRFIVVFAMVVLWNRTMLNEVEEHEEANNDPGEDAAKSAVVLDAGNSSCQTLSSTDPSGQGRESFRCSSFRTIMRYVGRLFCDRCTQLQKRACRRAQRTGANCRRRFWNFVSGCACCCRSPRSWRHNNRTRKSVRLLCRFALGFFVFLFQLVFLGWNFFRQFWITGGGVEKVTIAPPLPIAVEGAGGAEGSYQTAWKEDNYRAWQTACGLDAAGENFTSTSGVVGSGSEKTFRLLATAEDPQSYFFAPKAPGFEPFDFPTIFEICGLAQDALTWVLIAILIFGQTVPTVHQILARRLQRRVIRQKSFRSAGVAGVNRLLGREDGEDAEATCASHNDHSARNLRAESLWDAQVVPWLEEVEDFWGAVTGIERILTQVVGKCADVSVVKA